MGIIGLILLIVLVITSVLLIIIVMIQDDQGEGLGGIFGGGSSTSFGSTSGNVLTKTTSILGAIFLFCSFSLAWVNRTPEAGDVLGAARRGVAQEQQEWWNQPVEPFDEAPFNEETSEQEDDIFDSLLDSD